MKEETPKKNESMSEKKATEICQHYIRYGKQAAIEKYGEDAVDDAITV